MKFPFQGFLKVACLLCQSIFLFPFQIEIWFFDFWIQSFFFLFFLRWWLDFWSGTTICPSSGPRTNFPDQLSSSLRLSQPPTWMLSIMPWPSPRRRSRWSLAFSPRSSWTRQTSPRSASPPSTSVSRQSVVSLGTVLRSLPVRYCFYLFFYASTLTVNLKAWAYPPERCFLLRLLSIYSNC